RRCRRRPHLVDLPNRTNRNRTRQPQTTVERQTGRDPRRSLTGRPIDFAHGRRTRGATRIQAATWLADRGFGKPTQPQAFLDDGPTTIIIESPFSDAEQGAARARSGSVSRRLLLSG